MHQKRLHQAVVLFANPPITTVNGSDTNIHNESNTSDASSTLHYFEKGCVGEHRNNTSRKQKANTSHICNRDKHVREKQSRLVNQTKRIKLDLEPESDDSFSTSDGDFSDISNSSELSNGASHEASEGSFSDGGNHGNDVAGSRNVNFINGAVIAMENCGTNRFFKPKP